MSTKNGLDTRGVAARPILALAIFTVLKANTQAQPAGRPSATGLRLKPHPAAGSAAALG